mmetsp:Transcript_26892/g.58489  ORF Transcript_26892/g.58489 Transcript_26892/m.58489 type:complete len:135 (+) Transcript_26892:606-1010(+)
MHVTLEKVYCSLGPLIFAAVIVEELVTYHDWLAIPPGLAHMVACLLFSPELGSILHLIGGFSVYFGLIIKIVIWRAWWSSPASLVLAATCMLVGLVNISEGIGPPPPSSPSPTQSSSRDAEAGEAEVELQQVAR